MCLFVFGNMKNVYILKILHGFFDRELEKHTLNSSFYQNEIIHFFICKVQVNFPSIFLLFILSTWDNKVQIKDHVWRWRSDKYVKYDKYRSQMLTLAVKYINRHLGWRFCEFSWFFLVRSMWNTRRHSSQEKKSIAIIIKYFTRKTWLEKNAIYRSIIYLIHINYTRRLWLWLRL